MTKQELIEKEANEFFNKNNYSVTERSFLRQGFEDGINSTLNKDLTELAVIEGKIGLLSDLRHSLQNGAYSFMSRLFETQRKELLTKLNLEG